MNRIIRSITLSLAMILVTLTAFKLDVHAETEQPLTVSVSVNGVESDIRGLSVGYPNNRYISLVDMQALLQDTNKAFALSLSADKIAITTNDADANTESSDNTEDQSDNDVIIGWDDSTKSAFVNKPLSLNEISFNGEERRYYTIITNVGFTDCFIQPSDFCMLMDIDGSTDDEAITFDTTIPMAPVNPLALESYGYFQGVNSVLVGDATTGEIFYGYMMDNAFPIASTTKLMTYLLAADAISSGQVSTSDMVTISEEAAEMSLTSDGVTPMKAGQTVPFSELLHGALIVSSNECDHAISEYIAGDEATIVDMMNSKAAELSMSTAEFYNCNGLPCFTTTFVPAKQQNRMSSHDMFRLASHILNNYPEIKDITSIKEMDLEVLQKEAHNTNPVLYNMPEVTGLKTGTTNKSGACLVTSLEVNDGSVNHDIVVVLLGAEGSPDRGRVSELLARYGKAVVLGDARPTGQSGSSEEASEGGMNANAIVNMIVNNALKAKRTQAD